MTWPDGMEDVGGGGCDPDEMTWPDGMEDVGGGCDPGDVGPPDGPSGGQVPVSLGGDAIGLR
jgi:hypothetical protein